MKRKTKIALLATGLLSISTSANAIPVLFDWGFNIDGIFADAFDPTLQPGVETSAGFFDGAYGTVTATVTGTGAHTVGAYFNYDLGPFEFGFQDPWDETGAVSGTAAAGPNLTQSWEIDDSGAGAFDAFGNPIYFGDIVPNFFDNQALDNEAFYDGFSNVNYGDLLGGDADGLGSDVAMAMMWDFVLAPDEIAVIDFILAPVAAGGGLALTQADLSSPDTIVLTSNLVVNRPDEPPVPVSAPTTLALMGIGLGVLGVGRRRRRDVTTIVA